MSYFARLAQRSGIVAASRAAATEPAAVTATPVSPLEQDVETVAPPPEAPRPPTSATAMTSEPTARVVDTSTRPLGPAPHGTEAAPPDAAYQQPIEGPAERALRTIDAATPQQAKRRSREIANPAPSSAPERRQIGLVTPAAHAELRMPYAVPEPKAKVDVRAAEPAPAPPPGDHAALPLAPRATGRADLPARTIPPAAEEFAAAARPARDVTPPTAVPPPAAVPPIRAAHGQRDRPPAATMTLNGPRDRPAAARNGGPVEVRIGTVTLQLHSPPPAAPSPPAAAPGRSDAFSPHRHYLRSW